MIDLALHNEIKLESRSNLYACKSKTKSNFSTESRSTYCMQMKETKETLKIYEREKEQARWLGTLGQWGHLGEKRRDLCLQDLGNMVDANKLIQFSKLMRSCMFHKTCKSLLKFWCYLQEKLNGILVKQNMQCTLNL
jgi:hypothetical protein